MRDLSVSRARIQILAVLLALTVIATILHVGIGSYEKFNPLHTVRLILEGPSGSSEAHHSIMWDTRLPRAVLCLLCGAILGIVGSAFQGLFRNPLADPYIVGVSSGASVGGAIALIFGFGTWLGGLGIAMAGFVTGLLSLGIVYSLARRRSVVDVRRLLLAGVVCGSFMAALLSLVLLLAGHDTNMILRWLLGNTSLANWDKDAMLLAVLVPGSWILLRQSRLLNAAALGRDAATRLGVDVGRLTLITLLVGSAMTSACVGTVGIIGFLGLVAPHIARQIMGVDWRWSMPGSILVGALLLVSADLFAQRGFSWITNTPGMDLPVGIVTSVLGAPVLLVLLRREG